jgi:hypothetical protein
MRAEQIAHELGGARRNGNGWWSTRCCCHEDKNPSLSLRDGDNGTLIVHCFANCDYRDILAELRRRGLDDRRRDFKPIRKASPPPKRTDSPKDRHSDFAGQIWRESVHPSGTLAEKYLKGRNLDFADDLCGRVLRFHRRCPFGKDNAGNTIYAPALVVAFRAIRNDDETRPPQAIHRIGLRSDGTKIDKMMLGSVGGCAVKLDPEVGKELGVCEGFETGLAVRAIGWRPVWALGSAGAIRTLELIPGVEALTIFADHDPTGLAAARECAQRCADAGCAATVRTPKTAGRDWADA